MKIRELLHNDSMELVNNLKHSHSNFITNGNESEYMSKILNLPNLIGINGMIYVESME